MHPKEPLISVIIPTLNEEKYIRILLNSINRQQIKNLEILIVDAGSKDKTVSIAQKYGAKTFVYTGYGEFISRNIGAKKAKGKYLLFTCADIIFPEGLFEKIIKKFQENRKLIALTGPGYPYDASLLGKIEYTAYNIIRYIFAKFPKPLKRLSTSTNFLVVQKELFERTEGFIVDDINADGLMGRKLLNMGYVAFFPDTYFYLSARRMKNMGFLNFNRHYLYTIENFFFNLSNTRLLRTIKYRSKEKHRKMHDNE
jgi:glycosyltransferase involved in cell wall biosynthesis